MLYRLTRVDNGDDDWMTWLLQRSDVFIPFNENSFFFSLHFPSHPAATSESCDVTNGHFFFSDDKAESWGRSALRETERKREHKPLLTVLQVLHGRQLMGLVKLLFCQFIYCKTNVIFLKIYLYMTKVRHKQSFCFCLLLTLHVWVLQLVQWILLFLIVGWVFSLSLRSPFYPCLLSACVCFFLRQGL